MKSGLASSPGSMQRRQLLALAGLWAVAPPLAGAEASQPPAGWVHPRRPAPMFGVVGADGRRQPLPAMLGGKVTAVQLMFTGCKATCPTQGALFGALASRLRSDDIRLLSISIDSLGDTPATLSDWQAQFGRHPAWAAAVAAVEEVGRLTDFLKGIAARPGTHTAQVFVFDRQSQLCYRTGDSPAIGELEALLSHVSRQA